MRGKVSLIPNFRRLIGITPAYAGKSLKMDCTSPPHRDHPRLCGEKFVGRQRTFTKKGSPPPMRGKAIGAGDANPDTGDHPRLCGEKTKKIPKQRYFFHQPASFSFSLQYT